jgi:hypothetical protein
MPCSPKPQDLHVTAGPAQAIAPAATATTTAAAAATATGSAMMSAYVRVMVQEQTQVVLNLLDFPPTPEQTLQRPCGQQH